ncbi:MAG: hypothetical protein JW850_10595 [Thermoflexales bacterium]|nr:hypothetical protein [Thermoflexales bacterium]
MINDEDPKEWLAQIEQAPESAPGMTRLLITRLMRLEEENEALRDANSTLRRKIDTQAHQKEVDELSRQIEALARLVKARSQKHAPPEALILWAANGHALALDMQLGELDESSLVKYAFRFPARVNLHLLAAPLAEEILLLTNLGQAAVFKVEELARVTGEAANWHKIPDLRLGGGEFVALMTPIGGLPLGHSLVAASREGQVRSIMRWSVNRFLQERQFGRGVAVDRDVQHCAQVCFEQGAEVLLFTNRGLFLRFPESSMSPSLAPGIKLGKGEYVVEMVLSDRPEQEVLIVDAAGKGGRRALKSLPAKSMGTRPQPACSMEDVLGVRLVGEYDQVAVLMQNGRLAILDVDRAPHLSRSGPLAALPGVTHGVRAFTSFKSF